MQLLKHSEDKIKKKALTFLLAGALMLSLFGCSNNESKPAKITAENSQGQIAQTKTEEKETTAAQAKKAAEATTEAKVTQEITTIEEEKSVKKMTVSCESVNSEGRLLTICAAQAANGDNISPVLSWDAVEGAAFYAVFMVDTTAAGWLHLKTIVSAGKTGFEQDELSDDAYIGPYPPNGEHVYQFRVYALKGEPDIFGGTLDAPSNIMGIEDAIDKTGGQSGNILDVASFDVRYATRDNNV